MAKIYYSRVDEFWRKGEKHAYLEEKQHVGNIEWQQLQPDAKHNWLTEGMQSEFDSFVLIGSKEAKSAKDESIECVFKVFSNGNDSGRDDWVYSFDRAELLKRMKVFADTYNSELDRWHRSSKSEDLDTFVISDDKRIKWTRNAKRDLKMGRYAVFSPDKVVHALYRPFTSQYLYSGKIFNKEVALLPRIIPYAAIEAENRMICVGIYGRKSFALLMTNFNPNLNLYGDPHQAFPFYIYDEDGTNRRENITDWAVEKFREHYRDSSITKWDIFHYVYALLHHPVYRERYAANLKRELPRIPFAPDFRAFADAGARLSEIHVHYEQQPEYPLERIEQEGVPLNWRVEKMKLGKDKGSLVYNEFLTLNGLPQEAFEYRLGNRSALEWVIDQYQVSTERRSGITNDPNRADNPQYILRLVGQVITASIETVKIMRSLPGLGIEKLQEA